MWDMMNRGNKKVSIVEMLPRIGNDIGRTSRWIIVKELRKRGVEMYTNTEVLEVLDDRVKIRTKDGEDYVKADTVVVATGSVQEDTSFDHWRSSVSEYFKVGDCQGPGNALKAIREGFEVGVRI